MAKSTAEKTKKKIGLSTQIFIALLIGALFGVVIHYWIPSSYIKDTVIVEGVLYVVGQGFIRLMQMLVVPLVFCSLICGSMAIGDTKTLGKVGVKTIGFYLVTTALAVCVALGSALLINPGRGLDMDAVQKGTVSSTTEATSLVDTLLNIIPKNPVQSMANGDMLPIIVFALFVGIMLAKLGTRGSVVANFFSQFTFFLILAVVIILIAVFAPVVSGGVDPLKGSLDEALLAPSKAHIFGTDKMGRDIFARVIYGARASLTATFGVVALIFFIGTTLGVIAGYFGGIVDSVIMRIADMMLSFPGLVLALAVAGIMGASMKNAIVAVVVVNWTKYARLGRSLVLKIRHCDYVEAAIVTGSKTPYMILRYMLPNALPTLIITAATDIGGMMLELAAMSFLGFGAKPPAPEWGYMLNEGRACIQSAPWMMIFPGLAIFIVVVVFNMLGDSLRDILDPKDE